MWIGIVAVGLAGFVWLLRWLLKWRDPSWDSEDKQSRNRMWSKMGGSGGFGGH